MKKPWSFLRTKRAIPPELYDIKEILPGKWDCHTMADYCWRISSNCPDKAYKCKNYKHHFCALTMTTG